MSETKQQRSFGVVAATIVAIAGLLEFRNVAPDDRIGAAMLLVAGALVGFGIMFARERWLQKSGRRPLDKPSSGVLVAFYVVILGLVGLFRLLSPEIKVASYGLMLGVALGFVAYIGRDIQRLRPSPAAETLRTRQAGTTQRVTRQQTGLSEGHPHFVRGVPQKRTIEPTNRRTAR